MKRRTYLNHRLILKVLAALVGVTGVSMLMAVAVGFFYKDSGTMPLLESALICIAASGFLRIVTGRRTRGQQDFQRREGFITVTFSWIIVSAFGALPFILHGCIPSYTDAFFEAMSGFTTTGATILNDVESLPKSLLFWRSLTHWMGGIGIVVFCLAILPIMGIGGSQLFAAEATGPTKDKIHPRIAGTAKRLCLIYISLTVAQMILLLFGGLDLFDAVCHSFSTIATGGFSTKNDSVMSFSPYLQYVCLIFMILAGVNFSLYYFAIMRKFERIKENTEIRFYLAYIIFGALVLGFLLNTFIKDSALEANFRHAGFMLVSVLTTTGFVSTDYSAWIPSAQFILFITLFVGACAGSTTGGIKISRHAILFKNMVMAFRQLIHPRAIFLLRFNGRDVPHEIIVRTLAFFFLYITVFIFGSVIVSVCGYDIITAMSVVASSLDNAGPAFGQICATCSYAEFTPFVKWFLSFLMLIGRLELFTVLVIFAPAFWKR